MLILVACKRGAVTDTERLHVFVHHAGHFTYINTFISPNKYYQLGTGHTHTQTHTHFTDEKPQVQGALFVQRFIINKLISQVWNISVSCVPYLSNEFNAT